MALLAEEIVQEWLNRQGFFTMRGVRLGHNEVDLLAVGQMEGGVVCRHVEVQVSFDPINYISGSRKVGKKYQLDKPADVRAWVERKYGLDKTLQMRQSLWAGEWTRELVVHNLRKNDEAELKLIEGEGVIIHRFGQVVQELRKDHFRVKKAGGSNLIDLLLRTAKDEL